MKLIDVCELIVDCPHSTAKDEGQGIPLVRTPNIGKGRLELSGVHRVSEVVYNQRIERAVPQAGDLILAREAPVGNVALIMSGQKVCLGQRVVLIRPDKEKADPAYLTYYLLSEEVQHRLKNNANGAVVAHLNMNEIRNLVIELPEISIQKRIASVLSSLDDKIALNNRINHNLEEQAQALYKSWFVDFEPFKGGKFVDSELGMIPEGWHVGTLSELLEVRYGKDHKALKDGNTPVFGSGGLMRYAERALYNGESVLIPRKGTLNNVMYFNGPFWTVDTMFYTVERSFNVIKYCHLFLLTQDLASMNAGSAVPSMTTDILNNLPLLIPSSQVLEAFNRVLSSIYEARSQREEESNSLSQSRDTILPQLMSGALTNTLLTC
jgi:type I restriction enzyme S subunit